MKVLLINTDKLQPEIIETEGGLPEWYRLIGCNFLCKVSWKIGGKYFDIIADDEGLYRNDIEATILNKDQEPLLFGNIVVCNHNNEGRKASLTDEEISLLKDQIVILKESGAEKPRRWLAINNVETT